MLVLEMSGLSVRVRAPVPSGGWDEPRCSRETGNLIAKNFKRLYEDTSTELGERRDQARPQNKMVRTSHGGHRY